MEKVQSDSQAFRGQAGSKEGVTAVSIKGSVFTLPILKLETTDFAAIKQALKLQLASSPGFFKDSPVVLDLSNTSDWLPDFNRIRQILLDLGLMPAAIQNANTNQIALAKSAGLGHIAAKPSATQAKHARDQQNADKSAENKKNEASASKAQSNPVISNERMETTELESTTMVYDQPIRGGQRVYARGGDLIQLAAVNPGGEIMADGNIHIYAPLRGRALAGVNGNEDSRIFCHSMQAELVAVAGNYRVFEDNIPEDIKNKSVQIFLQNEQLIIRSIG